MGVGAEGRGRAVGRGGEALRRQREGASSRVPVLAAQPGLAAVARGSACAPVPAGAAGKSRV